MAFRAAATNVALIDPASLSVPSASILAVGGAPRTTPAQRSIVPMNRATPLRKSATPPTVIQIGTRRTAPANEIFLEFDRDKSGPGGTWVAWSSLQVQADSRDAAQANWRALRLFSRLLVR